MSVIRFGTREKTERGISKKNLFFCLTPIGSYMSTEVTLLVVQIVSGVASGLLLALLTSAFRKLLDLIKKTHHDLHSLHRTNSMQLNTIKELGSLRSSRVESQKNNSSGSEEIQATSLEQ